MSTLVFRDCRAQSLNTYYNTRVREKCSKGVQIRNNSRLQKVKTLRYESVLVQPGGFLYHNIPLHPSLGLFQLLQAPGISLRGQKEWLPQAPQRTLISLSDTGGRSNSDEV